jgi:hypothetical protein
MGIDEIRALKHAEPFRPFEIVTKNGRKVHIEQPIRIALSPTGDSVAGFGRDGSFFLPLSEIASVQAKPRRKRISRDR